MQSVFYGFNLSLIGSLICMCSFHSRARLEIYGEEVRIDNRAMLYGVQSITLMFGNLHSNRAAHLVLHSLYLLINLDGLYLSI